MITNLENYRFTTSHEWVRSSGKLITIGITEQSQRRLSDIISVDLPEPDDHLFEAGEEIAVIESVSSSMDVHAPVSGNIVSVNGELHRNPDLITNDPMGKGWLVKMKPASMSDIEDLMDIDQYEESTEEEEGDNDILN